VVCSRVLGIRLRILVVRVRVLMVRVRVLMVRVRVLVVRVRVLVVRVRVLVIRVRVGAVAPRIAGVGLNRQVLPLCILELEVNLEQKKKRKIQAPTRSRDTNETATVAQREQEGNGGWKGVRASLPNKRPMVVQHGRAEGGPAMKELTTQRESTKNGASPHRTAPHRHAHAHFSQQGAVRPGQLAGHVGRECSRRHLGCEEGLRVSLPGLDHCSSAAADQSVVFRRRFAGEESRVKS